MSPTGYNDKQFFFVKNTSQRYEMPSGQKGRRGGGGRDPLCVSLVAILAKVLTAIPERGKFLPCATKG